MATFSVSLEKSWNYTSECKPAPNSLPSCRVIENVYTCNFIASVYTTVSLLIAFLITEVSHYFKPPAHPQPFQFYHAPFNAVLILANLYFHNLDFPYFHPCDQQKAHCQITMSSSQMLMQPVPGEQIVYYQTFSCTKSFCSLLACLNTCCCNVYQLSEHHSH